MAKIDSPQNRYVKLAKSLHTRKGRAESGLFLVEGPSAVQEALMYARGIEWIVTCPERGTEDTDELAYAATEAGVPVFEAAERAFIPMTDAQSPQGILAAVRIESLPLSSIPIADGGAVLVLHDIRDPGNLGTMIRSADALGALGVVLSGSCVDPYDPKVVRATTGSIFHLPVVEADWAQVKSWAETERVSIYATDIDGKHPIGKVGIPKRVALVIGNEARGLPREVLQDATYAVRIPMSGRAESLNAAVAASILLFEAQRQQRADQ